ncbi:MAG: hypothetical protein KDE00_00040 [Rhodobacteraceae bacterium]|nr:hypothetical protein [Paracoccaceae bacterium]
MTDVARDRAELALALGEPGSGKRRYAAAMRLYHQGHLSAEALEVYRVCAARDGDDPALLLRNRGLGGEAGDPGAPQPDALIGILVDEADGYLATLQGDGIAEVRRGLAPWRGGAVRIAAPGRNPVVERYLPAALTALAATHPALAAAIGAAAPLLDWVTYDLYPPDEIGPAFAAGHAYASIVGADRAAIPARDFDLGLFLIAPDLLYRDHAHPAPELYAPLTGPHGWRFGPGRPLIVKPAHRPVWNPSGQPHLTKVGPMPFLCFYGWTRDVDRPAHVVPADDWARLEAMRIAPDGKISWQAEE